MEQSRVRRQSESAKLLRVGHLQILGKADFETAWLAKHSFPQNGNSENFETRKQMFDCSHGCFFSLFKIFDPPGDKE
jgi:hypothetical protein